MRIYYNDVLTDLPEDYMTLEGLAKWKDLPQTGTAIAVNNKVVRKSQWPVFNLSENDHVAVITAAFGG